VRLSTKQLEIIGLETDDGVEQVSRRENQDSTAASSDSMLR